jgi:hypothetical protein
MAADLTSADKTLSGVLERVGHDLQQEGPGEVTSTPLGVSAQNGR